MKKNSYLITCLLILVIVLSGCQRGTTVRVAKPRRHFLPYNPKKQKKKRRVRIVRMKS